jgi:hypothetical protein
MNEHEWQARQMLNDYAWVAENIRVLGHAVDDQEMRLFRRVAQICTGCMVGDEWARFRELTAHGRSDYLREWWREARIPGSVIVRLDNAYRAWFCDGAGEKAVVA